MNPDPNARRKEKRGWTLQFQRNRKQEQYEHTNLPGEHEKFSQQVEGCQGHGNVQAV